MEESLCDTPMYSEFVRLDSGISRLPKQSTILRFRYLLEANDLPLQIMATVNALLTAKGLLLKAGTAVDATLIAAPTSAKKGDWWYFGMKAHIGVDAVSGLVHTVIGPAAKVWDVTWANALLHGRASPAHGYAGSMP